MGYISIADAARLMNVSPRRLQQLCAEGKISGVKKEGHRWLIPEDKLPGSGTISYDKKPLPIGISDYKQASSEYYYVDKTMFIKEFLDRKPKVSLFTRPRRFGKTLNMDMLRVFFEKTPEDNSAYFKDKKISKCEKIYNEHFGKYPVIFLSFKDVKCESWQETYAMLTKLISYEFRRHIELENSDKLNKYEKKQFAEFAGETGKATDYQLSLQILSELLHIHYGKEVIIIVDEYDTPIQQGHSQGFYREVIEFMRNFFSGGLKDNPHLAYGFLTGILRVAKESIFSGLNNMTVNSVLDRQYSRYFGFTKEEVLELLSYYGCEEKYDEICEWYDGYLFGDTEIFNPWSVINYVAEGCFPKAFWQATGSNDVIGEIVATAGEDISKDLYKLMSNETVTSYIDTGVIYPEIGDNPYSIYSFLLVAGYLKVSKAYPRNDGNYMCDLAIPNKEITFVFEREVLSKTGRMSVAISIQQAIFSSDEMRLQKLLEEFMLSMISSFDGTNEGFYHGMMLGLLAVLSNQYIVKSNSESGYGRFDVALIPKKKTDPGFIFEFKHSKDDKESLEKLACEAITQIDEKKYETEMKKFEVSTINKTGIAFRGKHAVVKR